MDSVYMRICQLMTGQGGWPLNVFITPDQKPFYAGTYFPKTSKFNRPVLLMCLSICLRRLRTTVSMSRILRRTPLNICRPKQPPNQAKALASQRFPGHSSSLPAGLIRSTAVSGRHRNFRCPYADVFASLSSQYGAGERFIQRDENAGQHGEWRHLRSYRLWVRPLFDR